jgi:hypothetical protein
MLLVPVGERIVRLVAPPVGSARAGTGGVFPLRFARQGGLAAGWQELTQALQKSLHVVPADVFDRALAGVRFSLEFTVRISANVIGDFGNVTDLGLGAGLRG